MCLFWLSSSFNLLLLLGFSFGNHIAKPVRISDKEDGTPNKDPRNSFLVELINYGGLCHVDVGCSEVSFVSFLVLSCFLIKQMPSKQSDNMSLKRSEVLFFCLLISCISRQLEIIDQHFCLHASPFRRELACRDVGPDKAVQGRFGVLTEQETQCPNAQEGEDIGLCTSKPVGSRADRRGQLLPLWGKRGQYFPLTGLSFSQWENYSIGYKGAKELNWNFANIKFYSSYNCLISWVFSAFLMYAGIQDRWACPLETSSLGEEGEIGFSSFFYLSGFSSIREQAPGHLPVIWTWMNPRASSFVVFFPFSLSFPWWSHPDHGPACFDMLLKYNDRNPLEQLHKHVESLWDLQATSAGPLFHLPGAILHAH